MTVKTMNPGAVEFLTKPFREQELLDAILAALQRDRIRRDRKDEIRNLRTRFEALSAREQQTVALVTAGLMNKQVAAELGVSEVTVKVQVTTRCKSSVLDRLPAWYGSPMLLAFWQETVVSGMRRRC
jgi:FixJ family two-component response regulator